MDYRVVFEVNNFTDNIIMKILDEHNLVVFYEVVTDEVLRISDRYIQGG